MNVFAHGIGVRGDLPLEPWFFAWGVGIAVAASFAGLALLWHEPHLAGAATGRPVVSVPARLRWGVGVAVRLLGVTLLGLLIVAGLGGENTAPENWSPWAVYIGFWVGLQLLSALVGNVWGEYGPFAALARVLRRPTTDGWTHWPAAAGLAGFAWLELAYDDPSSPRAVGVAVLAHTVVASLGVWRWGSSWARHGEPFAAFFSLLGHLAPVGRDEGGRWTLRWPFAGLARMPLRAGTPAVVLVVLGSTTFDGVTRTERWGDIIENRSGTELIVVNTIGLATIIGAVAALYLVAVRLMAQVTGGDELELRSDFLPSLVPIALAYSIAHYFSLLVFEGQNVWYRLSDPLGRGWDLFGVAASRIDFLVVSPEAIAWIQVAAIASGHIIGVAVAHDRSIERFSSAVAFRSQLPMLGAMVAYSVVGLLLLLNA